MNELEKRKMGNEKFFSPTYGEMPLSAVIGKISEFMEAAPEYPYRLIIGTDSAGKNHAGVNFITALVIHRVGAGGIYFWKRKVFEVHSLRERIYREATISLEFAQDVIDTFREADFLRYDLEIHVDVGKKGETREMIAEIVGMIKGSGFAVKTKPDSFGASSVADRYAS